MILYFDAFSGVSGDKIVASLLSLIGDFDYLEKELYKLPVRDEFSINIYNKKIMGINALKFDVVINDDNHHHETNKRHYHHDHHEVNENYESCDEQEKHHHRGIKEIKEIIKASGISDNAKKHSLNIFEIIAEAEAKVHGISIDDVHFHEVGAIDSIVDIVSCSILFDFFNVDKVVSSPLALGSGMVKTSHGMIPVPAPATVEILKGIPVYATSIKGELTTPTGAAIIKYFATEFSDLPSGKIEKVGYGAGTKEFDIPNYLRAFLLEEYKIYDYRSNDNIILQIETNLDDSTPEQIAFLVDKLFGCGALDVYITPVVMKKNRQAQLVTVLCNLHDKEKIEEVLLLNSTTFGLRYNYLSRTTLNREIITINVNGYEVKVKLGYYNGKLIKKSFEYESIRELAEKLNLTYNEAIESVFKELLKIEV